MPLTLSNINHGYAINATVTHHNGMITRNGGSNLGDGVKIKKRKLVNKMCFNSEKGTIIRQYANTYKHLLTPMTS